MGKKSRKIKTCKHLPTISICTPTCNREHLFRNIIACVEEQDYPKELIQWVIVDDGEKSIQSYIEHLNYVTYVRLEEKVPIGRKRNITHEHCTGDIIVYMDDDDYYPPTRISHVVHKLNQQQTKKEDRILLVGSSVLHVYDTENDDVYEFGPYAKYHSTAGAFAFRRELLEKTSYEDAAEKAEEKHFLKNYSIPMIQLDPVKTILCISHNVNTHDKRPMFKNKTPTKLNLKNFVQSKSKWDLSLYSLDDDTVMV